VFKYLKPAAERLNETREPFCKCNRCADVITIGGVVGGADDHFILTLAQRRYIVKYCPFCGDCLTYAIPPKKLAIAKKLLKRATTKLNKYFMEPF
jgi:hypothetical protein